MSRTIPGSWLSRLPAGFGAVVLCLSACVVVQAIASSDDSGRMGREITKGLRVTELEEDGVSSDVLHFIDADQPTTVKNDPKSKKRTRDIRNDPNPRDSRKSLREDSESSGTDQLLETLLSDSQASVTEDPSPVDTPLSWLAVELQRFCQADKLALRGPEATIDIYGAREEIEATLLITMARRLQSGNPDPEHLTITFWTPSPEAQLWQETTIHAAEFRKSLLNANPETNASAVTTQSSIWPWTKRPCPAISVTMNARFVKP